ncbi:MAG: IscS subfamily cysteine desulfurase [Acidobacteria bacterium]|nr:MAG: IscS subfamily cysteine desulfurase [Acidobacteriota bacterium]
MRPRTIYLDHHATTPVDPAVVAAMLPYLTEKFGNPSSRQHVFGQEAHAAVEDARGHVAALIGAEPAEIVFTSGATESDNLALRGAARALAARGRHVVTTAIEHPAVLEPCRTLEKDGFEVTVVGVGAEGLVAPDDVAAALRPDTVLVSVMAANNEIGTIQPVEEIGRLCRDRGIVFHSDAVQALGRMPIAVDQWHTDLVSLSAHKMYGPKGVGALYVRRARRPRLRLVPQNEGGGQEKGVRSGTLNVPGIVGFGEAARLAKGALAGGESQRIAALRDRLLDGLAARIEGVTVNGSRERRLPGNLHVSIDRAEAETLILSLGGHIAISSGAACAEAGGKGSHVLRAIGLPDERIYTALRFGIGRFNDAGEIDSVVGALAQAVSVARSRAAAAPR